MDHLALACNPFRSDAARLEAWIADETVFWTARVRSGLFRLCDIDDVRRDYLGDRTMRQRVIRLIAITQKPISPPRGQNQ